MRNAAIHWADILLYCLYPKLHSILYGMYILHMRSISSLCYSYPKLPYPI